MNFERFGVYLVNLNPAQGSEIKKSRPCCIISPDEMNRHISTVIIAPLTSKGRNYPSRVNCNFRNTKGQIVLDQIRTVDKSGLVKKLDVLSTNEQKKVISVLNEMFAE